MSECATVPPRFDFDRKLRAFPLRMAAALAGDLRGALSTVYLDVNTEWCNHRCTFCDGFFRTLSRDHLPWSRLERLVDEMEAAGVLAVVLAGDRGEPLLHPEIDRLLARLSSSTLRFGIYTNGTVIRDTVWPSLTHAAFVRVSADAATAETHRRLHAYSPGRTDFPDLLSHVSRLATIVSDLGVSFVIDPANYREMAGAADLFLGLGAAFIEFKPQYLPGYRADAPWWHSAGGQVRLELTAARARWGSRVVVNNQIARLLSPSDGSEGLHVPARPCRSSLLRLVISTHGCYTCTPYRGEEERRVGDILTQSLESVVESALRRATIDRPCSRMCAYHDQNEALLELAAGSQSVGRGVDVGPSAPTLQDHFL